MSPATSEKDETFDCSYSFVLIINDAVCNEKTARMGKVVGKVNLSVIKLVIPHYRYIMLGGVQANLFFSYGLFLIL